MGSWGFNHENEQTPNPQNAKAVDENECAQKLGPRDLFRLARTSREPQAGLRGKAHSKLAH